MVGTVSHPPSIVASSHRRFSLSVSHNRIAPAFWHPIGLHPRITWQPGAAGESCCAWEYLSRILILAGLLLLPRFHLIGTLPVEMAQACDVAVGNIRCAETAFGQGICRPAMQGRSSAPRAEILPGSLVFDIDVVGASRGTLPNCLAYRACGFLLHGADGGSCHLQDEQIRRRPSSTTSRCTRSLAAGILLRPLDVFAERVSAGE